ncbi:MAG TPA: NHLP leader peptide family RiPP precursor [Chloroflexota bacterium]|nr:NHLP leader peptide family RiPP precursor [Chloroflexota bacterium]
MEENFQQTRAAIEARLVNRALNDEAFRQELQRDPRAAIEAELGMAIPAYLTVHVHHETPTDLHLVLPAVSNVAADGELSDADLMVAAAAEKQDPTITPDPGRSVGGVRG